MNYELALKLKKAGFPQKKEWDDGYFYCEDCKELHLFKDDPDEGNFVGGDYIHRWRDWPIDNWITTPTLEELIEAMGIISIYYDESIKVYIAINRGMDGEEYIPNITRNEDVIQGEGLTHLEAVANLYLALKAQ